LPTTTDTLVGKTTTDTLTNKTLTSPAIAGTPTGVGVLTSGTSVASTSGTSIDFTSIPSWVKRITVMLNGVSTNGTSNYQIQLGDSGGIETTGYNSGAWTQNINSTGLITSGLVLTALNVASVLYYGNIIISNFGSNTWVSSHSLGGPTGNYQCIGGGSKALSDTLTQLRITTVNGTDTFDAGSINILYE
jgi:hypothetical protein